jgi:hypothetical protein
MTITRLAIATGIDPELSGSGIITKGSIAKNIVYNKYVDGKIYATQRPAININGIASVTDAPPLGRGITYWDSASVYVFVNNDTVYIGGYGGASADKISPGRDPVQLLELQDYLVILDYENNEGWYLEASTPTTVTAISDSDFPANLPNVSITGGGAVLDGYLFVMDTKGTIYNSDLNDPTSWDATNFIASQREEDAGVFLTKHHDHLVAIGTKSIEFFYDAGNAVGSPIQPRQDISYVTGAVDSKSVFNTGDIVYFVGSEKTGTTAVYKIEQFSLGKISFDSIDTYLSNTRARSQFDFGVAGATVGDHHLVFISALAPSEVTVDEDVIDSWDPQYTLVFDSLTQSYVEFETDISTIQGFSVVATTERSAVSERESIVMFYNGDYGVFDLTFNKLDGASSDPDYVEADYIVNQNDYVQNLGQDTTANIESIILLPETDFGSVTNKFMYRLSVVGTTTANAEDATPIMVSWSDDHYRTFSEARELDTGLNRSLTRGGSFRRRAHMLTYNGTDVIRIEGIEVDLRASKYA